MELTDLVHSMQPSCFLDKAARQDVQQLLIVCKNKTLGCKWSGKLGTYFQVRNVPVMQIFYIVVHGVYT